MKASELRLGNLVSYNGVLCEVYSIEGPEPRKEPRFSDKEVVTVVCGGLLTVAIDELEAVPLTPELITQLGFKQQGNRPMWIKDRVCVLFESYFDIAGKKLPEQFWIGFKDLGNVLYHTTLKVETVHGLQNAAAITGEELTFNK